MNALVINKSSKQIKTINFSSVTKLLENHMINSFMKILFDGLDAYSIPFE